MVLVPVPTFEKVTVPVPVPLVKKLRFRFHNTARKCDLFYPSWIPDPGVKKALDPGSGSETLDPMYALLLCGAGRNINGSAKLPDQNPCVLDSVVDPNSDPPDPHVFGPPGSGSTSQRY